MNILIGFLIVIELLVSLLLTAIILVQPSKSGGGLGGAFGGGGGMGEQIFGARAGNVLTRGTILFATIFVVNTLALAFLYSRQGNLESELPTPISESEVVIPEEQPEMVVEETPASEEEAPAAE